MKNILITGSEGFIGSNLIRNLSIDNMVIGLDRGLQKHHNIDSTYIYYHCDVVDKDRVLDIVRIERPDTIIHLAADPGVRTSLDFPEKYYKNNLDGMISILEACRLYGIKLIYASSSSVYGSDLVESDMHESRTDYFRCNPLNPYSNSKLMCEDMAKSYSKYYGVNAVGLRLFNVYGPFLRDDLVINIWLKDILGGKKSKIALVKRDFTYVTDVISAIRVFIETDYHKEDIYNVGKGQTNLIIDAYKELCILTGNEPNYEIIDTPKVDMIFTNANIQRMIDEFDWEPKVTLNEGLFNYYQWYMRWNT